MNFKKYYTVFLLIAAFLIGVLSKKIGLFDGFKEPKIFLEETIYDFNEIPQGKEVKALFKFQNIGSKSVIINKVETRCGCSIAHWNTESIPPKGIDSVLVLYDAEEIGYFSKEIIVQYNNKYFQKLFIKGTVLDK